MTALVAQLCLLGLGPVDLSERGEVRATALKTGS